MLGLDLPPLSSYLRRSTEAAPSLSLETSKWLPPPPPSSGEAKFASMPLLLNPIDLREHCEEYQATFGAALPISASTSHHDESTMSPHNRKRCRSTRHDISYITLRPTTCAAHYSNQVKTKESTSHGGIYYCIVEGCTKQRLKKGLCFAHGGVSYCKIPGCEKTRQKRGLCKAHGGVAYCKAPNCNQLSNAKGLCRDHGGIKYCRTHGCRNLILRAGLCRMHGEFEYCKVPYCSRIAIEGGNCRVHTTSSS